MSHDRILTAVAAYYTRTLEVHGAVPAGVDWNGVTSQAIRFRELARILDRAPLDPEPTLLDYGCGYGAMARYLDTIGRPVRYTGFDVARTMIAAAEHYLAGRQGARLFSDAVALTPHDYVVASGVFNVKGDETDAAWRDYVFATLAELDGLGRRGWAANFLTKYSHAERMRTDLHYADPSELFDWAKRSASRHVAILHDYELWEFTLLVRKDIG